MSLQVKKASLDEKTELFSMVHDVWPHHPDKKQHTKLRLESTQHLRADWYVGRLEDELTCGLGVYRASVTFKGRTHKLAMIGAVYTAKQHRRNAYAAKLLKEVMSTYKEEGYELFMLYSDIAPSYYQKLGFKLKKMSLTKVDAKNNELKLEELALEEYEKLIPELSSMIERQDDYRSWLLKRSRARLFANESKSIYVLLGEHEGEDYILESSQNGDLKAFIEQLASDLKIASLNYWGELSGLKAKDFELEIPMFLSDSIDVDELIKDIKLFPIDHV